MISDYYHLNDNSLELSLRPYLEIATLITDCSVSFISIIDDEMQYFITTKGFESRPIRREESLCHYTMQGKEPFVIEDLANDPRVPKSGTYEGFGYYIGVPILDGFQETIGTYCVLGTEPREVNDKIRLSLNKLGLQVAAFLQRRKDLISFHQMWKNSNEELETSKEKLNAYQSRITHDLKGPVNVLKGVMDLVQSDRLEGIEDYKLFFEASKEKIDHLQKMMHQLSDDLFRKEKARNKILENISIEKMVGIIVQVNDFKTKYGEFKIEVDDLIMKGEYSDVYIVFQNLIENAIKYNIQDIKHIKITSRDEGEKIFIAFEDNGLGIPKNRVNSIFTRGERVHTDLNIEGTGLGLHNVAQIVNDYGGEILVESIEGKGSIFKVHWPVL